jgi:dTDP-4-dehydrorhamnose 3,5-epimerase
MIYTETAVAGAFIIDCSKLSDSRGFFSRSFCAEEFAQHGLESRFVQSNISLNHSKFTVRGMHMQADPFGEVKLVRCTRGAVFDALIDLRPDSPTFGKWAGAELTADNHRSLYVPKGCAHGYQTLRDESEVFYLVSEFYSPGSERGFRWNDPAFGIDWPEPVRAILSDKDSAWPLHHKETA